MPNGIQTRVIEGDEIVTNGSTICAEKAACDRLRGESQDGYIRRHAREHSLGDFHFVEDAERNLSLYCLYFFHKYIIGNPKLLADPFWEIHDFVANWSWHQADLALPTLPKAKDRRPGEHRRYKQLEVPRKCQKTSTVSKAYATQESLRQYFIFGNIHFRIILTSATSTLTTGLLRSYKAIWSRNQNIKRLFGLMVTRGKGRNAYTERQSLLSQNCKAGINAIAFRWLSDSEDASGKAAFNFMVAGVQTELVGQRADLYIFDDPASDKNSNTTGKRAVIRNCFSEQARQLEHTGRMIVCNTRKHLEDFGGMIHKEPLASRFHSLHRKAVRIDDAGEKHFYYPIDGEGEAQLDEKNLELLKASMPEHQFSSEYLNEPLDPERAQFRREDFQIIPMKMAPVEIRYGLGKELTPEEAADLHRDRVEIFGYNHCDPAGKEQQSKRGDDSAIVGWRRDRFGSVYVTYLRSGQWTSSQLWEELYAAFCFNRPLRTDYEKPTNDLHTAASYQGWIAKKQKAIDDATPKGQTKPSADIRPLFQNVPHSTKFSRIDQMEPILRNKRFYIVEGPGTPAPEIEKFVGQFISLMISDHDDYPDCCSRMVPILGPQNFVDVSKPPAIESDFIVDNGVTRIQMSTLLEMNKAPGDGLLWGQKGRSNAA